MATSTTNAAKQLTQALNGETTITLLYPVRLATGQMLEKVTVRRPRVGDLRAVAHLNSDAEQELAMFSRLSGLVPEDLDDLDMTDYKAIQDWFRTTQQGEAA